jgi:hypothetical protein
MISDTKRHRPVQGCRKILALAGGMIYVSLWFFSGIRARHSIVPLQQLTCTTPRHTGEAIFG